MRFSNLIVSVALVGLLSACAGGLDKAAEMEPNNSDFLNALHTGYVDLARVEAEEWDWADADYFVDKARRAGADKLKKGEKRPIPDAIASRNLAKKGKSMLIAARKRLMKALNAGGRSRAALVAAKAQTNFDCWIQEQEENTQPEDIALCRSAFFDWMDMLEDMMPKAVAAMAPAKPMKKKKKKKKKVYLGPFFVYFGFDQGNVEGDSNADILDLAAGTAKKVPGKKLMVVGHTDRAGSGKYNQVLSERRAMDVKSLLIERGISHKNMIVSSMGEAEPDQPTKDGVRSDANRRVEISFR